ncbi:MAG TPA: CAP domain-containing protein, partial [Pilimelia sp.]|nr:CAP domain-containing protein [Pilimelia sp.]
PRADAHQPHADTYRPRPDAYRPVGHGPWPGPVESQPPGDVVTAVPVAEPHRTGTRLPGPIGLAALVAALLVTFGVGAFLLSPTLANPRDTAGAQLPNGVGAPAPADPSTAAASPPPTAPVAGVGPASPLAAAPTSAAPTSAAAAAPATSAPAVERAKPSPTKARSATVAREDQVTTLVNKARVAAGCRAVRTDERLRTAARGHSKDMARRNYFAHDSLDGRSPWDRAKAAGYAQPIGENIAKGQRTPADVMQAWLNSPGHRRNILNCDARATGVGLVYDGSTPIWTQMFGSR